MTRRLIVFRERSRLRWGGDIRRHYILEALAGADGAVDVDGWGAAQVRASLPSGLRIPWGRPPLIAAATMLAPEVLRLIGDRAVPLVVDFHDDPILQALTLGIEPDPAWLQRENERKRLNLAMFRHYLAPSAELAALGGLDASRTIVAGSGTDPVLITPQPWPSVPAIGFISGASPGRGIETLIAAARLVRTQITDARLLLWLAATGAASQAYLAALQESTRSDPWIEYATAPYDELAAQLGRAVVHCVPNPPLPYWDAVSPIKLFDDMASGRPLVVTPRVVMRADVERHKCGLVASGDRPEDLADALARVLSDEAAARAMGANGRAAAVAEHDWRLISRQVAEAVLRVSAAS